MGATVTDARENRRGNGMEVPCKYKLKGPKTYLSKAEYIIRVIVSRRQTNLGDLNCRTGVEDEIFVYKIIDSLFCIGTDNTSIDLPPRKKCGKNLINICRIFNLKILNGRKSGDPIGINTYNDINLVSSTIDYGICSQVFYLQPLIMVSVARYFIFNH